ncbi:hypothetical protein Tco_0888313 [Tanacetum coccineum]
MPAYDRAICPVSAILSTPGKVLGIIPKGNLRIPICRGNVRGTFAFDALHVVSLGLGVRNPMLCLESSLVAIADLLQMLLDARIDFWLALRFHVRLQVKLEERVRLLVGSPGASTTLIYSPGSSSTSIYSPGSSTPPRYSPGASTPQSYSPGSSRNAECSNCKHLLDKITVLEATVKMYMHPEQHTVNSAALLHEVYNGMGKLDLE